MCMCIYILSFPPRRSHGKFAVEVFAYDWQFVDMYIYIYIYECRYIYTYIYISICSCIRMYVCVYVLITGNEYLCNY